MNKKILNAIWYQGHIGIIAVDYPQDGYWQAYLGKGIGHDEQTDAEYIANWGDKLTYQQAQVFFPDFDITKYKTYPKNE